MFAERHSNAILEFATQTFLRHFSLYEFAFKPRVELVMKTAPAMVTTMNAKLESLGEMESVEGEEAAKMKSFLGASKIEGTG